MPFSCNTSANYYEVRMKTLVTTDGNSRYSERKFVYFGKQWTFSEHFRGTPEPFWRSMNINEYHLNILKHFWQSLETFRRLPKITRRSPKTVGHFWKFCKCLHQCSCINKQSYLFIPNCTWKSQSLFGELKQYLQRLGSHSNYEIC